MLRGTKQNTFVLEFNKTLPAWRSCFFIIYWEIDNRNTFRGSCNIIHCMLVGIRFIVPIRLLHFFESAECFMLGLDAKINMQSKELEVFVLVVIDFANKYYYCWSYFLGKKDDICLLQVHNARWRHPCALACCLIAQFELFVDQCAFRFVSYRELEVGIKNL